MAWMMTGDKVSADGTSGDKGGCDGISGDEVGVSRTQETGLDGDSWRQAERGQDIWR